MRVHLAALGLALTAALVGCGSDEGAGTADDPQSPSGGSAANADEAEPAEPSVAREPFCADVDGPAAAKALGVPPAAFAGPLERKPGEEYEPIPGEKLVEDDWYCKYASGYEADKPDQEGGYVSATVSGKPALADQLQEAVAEAEKNYTGGKAECTTEDQPDFGDGGTLLLCTRAEDTGQSGFSDALVYGLFDDALVTCVAGLAPTVDAERVRAAAEAICADVLTAATA